MHSGLLWIHRFSFENRLFNVQCVCMYVRAFFLFISFPLFVPLCMFSFASLSLLLEIFFLSLPFFSCLLRFSPHINLYMREHIFYIFHLFVISMSLFFTLWLFSCYFMYSFLFYFYSFELSFYETIRKYIQSHTDTQTI